MLEQETFTLVQLAGEIVKWEAILVWDIHSKLQKKWTGLNQGVDVVEVMRYEDVGVVAHLLPR